MTSWTRILFRGASAPALIGATPAIAPTFAQPSAPQEEQPGPAPDPQAGPQTGPGQQDPDCDVVSICDRAIEQVGEAQSASEGVVGYLDFETRPLLRPGELVEVIPGMAAAQHSGGGKAN